MDRVHVVTSSEENAHNSPGQKTDAHQVGNDPSSGFSPRWRGVVEYIEDITYRIWEQGNIDFINDTYSKICPVFTLQSCCAGSDVVIANTKAALKVFPDRTLYPEAVLWNGDNGDGTGTGMDDRGNVRGYHSSHLINSRMTYRHPEDNSSDSDFPSSSHGKKARIWVIAHCIIQDGIIVKEWLVRDNEFLFEQLGVCPKEVAEKWSEKWIKELEQTETNDQSSIVHITQHAWLKSEYNRVTSLQVKEDTTFAGGRDKLDIDLQNIFPMSVREKYSILGNFIASRYKRVWGKEGMYSKERFSEAVKAVYHPHARFESPQNRDAVGHKELEDLYDSFLLGNGLGENVALSLDWIIVNPDDEKRSRGPRGAKMNDGSGIANVVNAWVYPHPSDKPFNDGLFNVCENNVTNEEYISECFTLAIRWTLVGLQKQIDSSDLKTSLPVVLLAESHLRCAGVRIKHDITVYDAVGLQAQLEMGKKLSLDSNKEK